MHDWDRDDPPETAAFTFVVVVCLPSAPYGAAPVTMFGFLGLSTVFLMSKRDTRIVLRKSLAIG